MTKQFTRKKIMGATMMEALLFLGITAIVLIGAFSLYTLATSSNKMNTARTQVQTYVSGVKQLYSSQSNYSSLNNALVISAAIPPKNAITGATTLVDPWGGSTTITGAATTFNIAMSGIPQSACTELLSSGLVGDGSVIGLQANSTSFTADADPGSALAACTNLSNNTVTFTAH